MQWKSVHISASSHAQTHLIVLSTAVPLPLLHAPPCIVLYWFSLPSPSLLEHCCCLLNIQPADWAAPVTRWGVGRVGIISRLDLLCVSQASTQVVWNRWRHARRLTRVPGWKSRNKFAGLENPPLPYLWCRWHTVLPLCPPSPPPCCISAWRMISLFSQQTTLQLRGHSLRFGACMFKCNCQIKNKWSFILHLIRF